MCKFFCRILVTIYLFIVLILAILVIYYISINDNTINFQIPCCIICIILAIVIINNIFIINKECCSSLCIPKKKQIIELTEIVITNDNFVKIFRNI